MRLPPGSSERKEKHSCVFPSIARCATLTLSKGNAMVRSYLFMIFACTASLCAGCEEPEENSNVDDSAVDTTFSFEQCPLPCEGVVSPVCQGDILVGSCDEGFQSCTDCSAENKQCIFDGIAGQHRCALRNRVSTVCIPECAGLVCGPDGCGGSCGFCPQGGVCDSGTCWEDGMSCEVVTEPLWCLGEVLASCVEKKLKLLDCAKLGRVCGRSETTGKIECLVLLD